MNNQWLMRTRTLLGDPAMEQLQNATVAVLGLGGVGGAAAEAVCRMGVGRIILIDNDSIDSTNCNRQLFATAQTVGQSKCLAAKERLLSINPDLELICHQQFFLPENSDFLFEQQPDLILDAIDTVTGKIALVLHAQRDNVPVISSMGAGNKLDASQFEVADIYKTSVCPLAKVMRRELKRRGVKHLKVVYSKEVPLTPDYEACGEDARIHGKQVPGSSAFVPSVAGLILAGEVVKDLIQA